MKMHRPFGLRVDELLHQGIRAVTHIFRSTLRRNPPVSQNDHLVGNPERFV